MLSSSLRAHRRALFTALLCTVAVGLLPASASASADVKVMTRNMYLGTGLTNLVGTSGFGFVSAATTDWANVKIFTNFNGRVGHLADEIQANAPDLVGLQEVSLWRSQFPGDAAFSGTTPATTVEFDFLAQLQAALASRGLRYDVAATSTNADVEAPTCEGFSPSCAFGFRDVRLTDRDVILVNRRSDDLVIKASGDGHYVNQLLLPVGGGLSEFTRGFTYVDAISEGLKFRFFNTHLEVDGGPAGAIQELQGDEAIAGPLASSGRVIAVGDYNSPATGLVTATYDNLIASGLGDGWSATHPGDPGLTCCHNELLSNGSSVGEFGTRIDLALSKGRVSARSATIVGEDPADRFLAAGVPGGWPSDHAGVVATFRLR